MSVILYSKSEIVDMLAACWNHGSIGSLDGKRRLERYAEMGARISEANRQAYEATYPDDPAESATFTADEVCGAIVRQTVERKQRGLRTLDGIRYNVIANNGQDFATADILEDLVSLLRVHLKWEAK